MGNFSIRLRNELDLDGEKYVLGTIVLGTFSEDFHASLSYWSCDDYINQWNYSLRRLIEGQSKSVLITSMYEPSSANFIFWWPMYLDGEKIYVQNSVLFLDQVESTLDEGRIYDYIPERQVINEDGVKISEWELTLQDIKDFLTSDRDEM